MYRENFADITYTVLSTSMGISFMKTWSRRLCNVEVTKRDNFSGSDLLWLKLKEYGIHDPPHRKLSSFLTRHTQQVEVNTIDCDEKNINK